MREVGALVPHRLALLEESVTALRALLRGEEVTVDGKAVHLERMSLVHPPEQAPPVITGVIGPRSLELSGRIADGTLVAEGHGPDRLPGIRALIDAGRAARAAHAARSARGERGDGSEKAAPDHEIIVFTHLILGGQPERVEAELEPLRADLGSFLGIPEDEVFTVSGDAASVAGKIRSLWDAGADTVVLRPVGDDHLGAFTRALAALRG